MEKYITFIVENIRLISSFLINYDFFIIISLMLINDKLKDLVEVRKK